MSFDLKRTQNPHFKDIERKKNRMKELRVIIAGSRDFNDYDLLKKSAIDIFNKKTMLPDLSRIAMVC